MDRPTSLAAPTPDVTRAGPADCVLDVLGLSIELRRGAERVRIVEDVGFSLRRGRTLALVGESGCGKTLTAMSTVRLLPSPDLHISAGTIRLFDRPRPGAPPNAVELTALSERKMRPIRGGRIAVVFQEPMTALNPVMTIGEQIIETVRLHKHATRTEAKRHTQRWLERVGIRDARRRMRDYPHEFSGGMRQRAMIAMALAGDPSVLIADEPTTALDVTVQARVLDLLEELQTQTGLAILLVTHDLGVVARSADDVCVLYAGQIVEQATVRTLLEHPVHHPYTDALLGCLPTLDQDRTTLQVIPGQVPDPAHYPPGCRFHPRCLPARRIACSQQTDVDTDVVTLADGARIPHTCANGPLPIRPVAAERSIRCPYAS